MARRCVSGCSFCEAEMLGACKRRLEPLQHLAQAVLVLLTAACLARQALSTANATEAEVSLAEANFRKAMDLRCVP